MRCDGTRLTRTHASALCYNAGRAVAAVQMHTQARPQPPQSIAKHASRQRQFTASSGRRKAF
jgi:hypothetical protein